MIWRSPSCQDRPFAASMMVLPPLWSFAWRHALSWSFSCCAAAGAEIRRSSGYSMSAHVAPRETSTLSGTLISGWTPSISSWTIFGGVGLRGSGPRAPARRAPAGWAAPRFPGGRARRGSSRSSSGRPRCPGSGAFTATRSAAPLMTRFCDLRSGVYRRRSNIVFTKPVRRASSTGPRVSLHARIAGEVEVDVLLGGLLVDVERAARGRSALMP